MKRKEFLNELQGLTLDDLKGRARSMAEELMKLRFRKASGQLEQSHRMAVVRKNLARVKTMLTRKADAAKGAAK